MTPATSRRASARTARRAGSRASGTVAPAARACPPPPNAPVRTVASTPPGLVRTLIRVSPGASLKMIATSAASAWASRSMIPSESGGSVPVAARSDSSRVDQTTRRVGRALETVEDPPEQAQLPVRLRPVQAPRDLRQRRAGLDQGGSDLERAGGDVGMGECRRVHDDPGHQRGGQRAVGHIEGHAEAGRQEDDHLAGGGGMRARSSRGCRRRSRGSRGGDR